jgi:hypothetical protein
MDLMLLLLLRVVVMGTQPASWLLVASCLVLLLLLVMVVGGRSHLPAPLASCCAARPAGPAPPAASHATLVGARHCGCQQHEVEALQQ